MTTDAAGGDLGDDSDPKPPALRPGIRVTRGSTLMIPAGGLVISIGENGLPTMDVQEFRLASSTWLDWLHIALERADDVKAARKALTKAVTSGDEAAENDALERELRTSLQVVTAAVSGLEGFYGLIEPHIEISAEERAARRRKRTGRAIWVADGIFRAARIPGGMRSVLRKNLISTYKARNLAVHPEDAPRLPVIHPVLRQMVPSYLATFTWETSAGVIATCVEAILWVLDRPRPSKGTIFELSESASALVHELADPRLTFQAGGLLKPKAHPGP